MGRPNTVTELMEDFIHDQLLQKPRPKADTIYRNLIDKIEKEKWPEAGESAIIKRITKIKREIDSKPPSEYDDPWSIGASLKYDIPDDVIPMLIYIKDIKQNAHKDKSPDTVPPHIKNLYDKINETLKKEPTIRQARWFARLFKSLDAIFQDKQPDITPKARIGKIFIISSQYARKEQIAEFQDKDYPNTVDLDNIYFINQSLNVVEGMLSNIKGENNDARSHS